jgi:hypothetical protein
MSPSPTSDFDFLQGSFCVEGPRLRNALDPDSGWVDVSATSRATVHFNGAVSLDEMWFPDEQYFGMSLRLWDPTSRTWTVRWLTSRDGELQPPVQGQWDAGRCRFTGPDTYRGVPIHASYSWSELTETTARWEQCFSVDGARTWQPNWTMHFERRDAPAEHPVQPRVTADFDFLAGRWTVHHRRWCDPLRHALGGPSELSEFDGVHVGGTYFAGAVSVDETTLADPDTRGLTFRVWSPSRHEWSIYWVNSRTGRLEPPVHGSFIDGVGTFYGQESIDGHEVEVRFIWSDITETSARWSQAFRVDNGEWDHNWEMTFSRPSAETAR